MNNSTTLGINNNTWVAAGTSFVTSFAVTTAFTGNPTIGVTAGAVAAVASIVNELADPVFRQLRSGTREDALHYVFRTLVVIGLVSAAADKLINFKVNILASFITTTALYLLARRSDRAAAGDWASKNITMI